VLEREPSLSRALREALSADRSLWPLVTSPVLHIVVLASGWIFYFSRRRRHLEQLRLRRSESKYRNIINHAGEAIFLLDDEGRVQEWNKAAEVLFSAPRRDVLGRPFREIHFCYGMEMDRARADADKLGRSLTFEFPFPRAGRTGGQISLTISPITAAGGQGEQARAHVVIARDITSEKQLATKMSETEKLAGIGQLAAGIAHQLNTPLGSILLSAQMLEDTVKAEDEIEDVRRIIRQTEQCRGIIKGLLNFARPSGEARGLVNLAEAARETMHLLDKNIKLAGVEVVIEERAPAGVLGNRNELDQVFFNLLANALDAMPGGGRVKVTIGEGAPGEIEVVFADTGEGIAPAFHDQVFLPFFTTKEYGKGTGLGLSIVARILHEHGGRIEMQSRVGEGTSFTLTFPRPRFASGPEGM
jgi:two-component system, NtrC family, sensor kinase